MHFIVSAGKVAVGSSLAALRLAGAGCSTITPAGAQIPSHILLQHNKKKVEGKEKLEVKSISLNNPGRLSIQWLVWPQIHLFWCKWGVQSLDLPPGNVTS